MLSRLKINLKPNLTCGTYISYKKTTYLIALIKICLALIISADSVSKKKKLA